MRRQGFTLVEVMVALGVMTISAMALFGMQAQSTRANGRARDITVASQIAQNVLERMKLDGLAWNSVGLAADVLVSTDILRLVGGTPGAFMSLPETSQTRGSKTVVWSNAFDLHGIDVPIASAQTPPGGVRFCASQRLAWVFDTPPRAMRADVRVWWSKEAPTRSILADFPACADTNVLLAPGGARYEDYHTVYMSTVIRPHPK
jgi:prepilin-type N-terminal cleavage/methylation domain-containing protein